MQRSPSGEQWTIAHGGQSATVVQVGGGLRTYAVGGRSVLAGYGVDEVCDAGRGQLLMPWPNRIRDGRYAVHGTKRQLALTEPPRHNAIHGLVRWALWSLEHRTESELVVGYALHPQQGWGWHLDLTAAYRLDDDGLTVEVTATNSGSGEAPFGFGTHPYVAIGEVPVADVTLQVPGERWVAVEPDRMLPVGTEPVEGTAMDFREARALGGASLDTAFTGLRRDDDGRWRVHVGGLGGGDGSWRSVTVWGGEGLDWVQVFTGKATPDGSRAEPGVAVEPMSCPADAFNSGDGVVLLGPGETWSARWGVQPGV